MILPSVANENVLKFYSKGFHLIKYSWMRKQLSMNEAVQAQYNTAGCDNLINCQQ